MVGGDGIEPPISTELTDTVDEVGPQIAIAVEAIQARFALRLRRPVVSLIPTPLPAYETGNKCNSVGYDFAALN